MVDDKYELTALRAIRETSLAIRELESQAAATAKRYKRGIKLLSSEVNTIEATLDDGGAIEGMEPWNIQSEKLKALIADPKLDNIDDDCLL